MFETKEIKVTRVNLQEGFLLEIVEEEELYNLWMGTEYNAFKMSLWPEDKDQTVEEIVNKLKSDPQRILNCIEKFREKFV